MLLSTKLQKPRPTRHGEQICDARDHPYCSTNCSQPILVQASRRAFHSQVLSSLTSTPPPASVAYNRHRKRSFTQCAAATQYKEDPTKSVGRYCPPCATCHAAVPLADCSMTIPVNCSWPPKRFFPSDFALLWLRCHAAIQISLCIPVSYVHQAWLVVS